MECWGASGGGTSTLIGYGGYTAGDITLNSPTVFWIHIGGQGVSKGTTSSYNGGGIYHMGTSDEPDCSGGGATDIRIDNGTWDSVAGLCSRIMVAAGGGGFDDNTTTAAFAGGLWGYLGNQGVAEGTQANQFHGGYIGSWTTLKGGFGHGCLSVAADYGSTVGGGGSGYYGGGSSDKGTQGGSSYISGHAGCSAITAEVTDEANITHKATEGNNTTLTVANATHYSGYKFTNTVMIDGAGYRWTTTKGSLQAMPKAGEPGSGNYDAGVGHTGNGYCRITLRH